MLSKRATWFPSHALKSTLALQPVFLYHVPRTGGTTLFAVLRHAFDTVFELLRSTDPDIELPLVGRYDDPALNTGGQHTTTPFCLMASHNSFGFHEHFANPFHLVTVLRDPVERVVSAYTYARMREGRQPEITGFEAFVRAPENRDVATRQLVGIEPGQSVSDKDTGHAIETLETRFYAFATTAGLREIGSALLTLNGLPNVLAEPLNATLPEWRLDTAAHSDLIASHNTRDATLYDYVARHPRSRFADLCPDPGVVNPVTTLILDRSDAESAKADVVAARTADIVGTLDVTRAGHDEILALAARLRSIPT